MATSAQGLSEGAASSSGARRFAVVGRPISHSLSPRIHTDFAKQRGLPISYQRLECADEDFAKLANGFFADGGAGLNITTPFKEQAHALCQLHSAQAVRAGAVNTIRLAPDGQLEGHTTDGEGLCRDLSENLGIDLGQTRTLILGAGATARTVALSLAERRLGGLVVFNRTPQRAESLCAQLAAAEEFAGLAPPRVYAQEDDGQFGLIINCAAGALGAGEVALPSLPRQAGQALAYDLSYGRGRTAFAQWAQESLACRSCDGVGMLVEQAALAFVWWHGEPMPETQGLIKALGDRPEGQGG